MQEKAGRRYEAISRNTEKMFAESLKRLLKEMPLKKISVQKLADDCGVNRKTFYYHFDDIDDLLSWTLEQDAVEVFQNIEACEEPEELLRFCIDYMDKNRKLMKMVLREHISFGRTKLYGGCHRIVRLMVERVERERKTEVPEEYREFVLEFYTDALAQSCYQYICQQTPEDGAKRIQYLLRLLQCSIPAVLKEKTG